MRSLALLLMALPLALAPPAQAIPPPDTCVGVGVGGPSGFVVLVGSYFVPLTVSPGGISQDTVYLRTGTAGSRT